MAFLLLVTYCKLGKGQVIGMMVMMMMMIGLSSCPVNTRSRREIKQQKFFCSYLFFFVFIALKVAEASLIVAVGNLRPAAHNDVSFQAS